MKCDLPTLVAEVNSMAHDTQATFGQLTLAQLNWKPSPERWSVAQCFDHLFTSTNGYFPIIESVLAGQKRTVWQRVPFLPAFWGSLLVRSMDPASTRKVKAPKKFQPAQSDFSSAVINDFIDQQNTLAQKMKATEHLDLERIIIGSPVTSAITYSLMDAYRLIVVHEQRHFQQAKRVTDESHFPRQD